MREDFSSLKDIENTDHSTFIFPKNKNASNDQNPTETPILPAKPQTTQETSLPYIPLKTEAKPDDVPFKNAQPLYEYIEDLSETQPKITIQNKPQFEENYRAHYWLQKPGPARYWLDADGNKKGGMSLVFNVYDRRLQMIHIAKMIKQNVEDTIEGEAKLVAYLQAAKSVPNLPKVYDLLHDDYDQLIMITEKIEGPNLHEFIQTHKDEVTPEMVEDVISKMAETIDALNTLDVKHRDFKPGNIVLDKKNNLSPVLIDFGLATGVIPGEWDAGTKGFKHPLLTTGKIKPSIQTELYSLARTASELIMCMSESDRIYITDLNPVLKKCNDIILDASGDPEFKKYPEVGLANTYTSATEFANELSEELRKIKLGPPKPRPKL